MNKKIIVAVFVIGGAGVTNAIIANKPLTPIILGSYVFLLVLSILDAFGGPMSTLSGALAMLAMTVAILTEVPWSQIIGLVQGNGPKGEAGAPPLTQGSNTAGALPGSRTQN